MTASLGELCQRARPELACLGELGRPLLEVLTVVERRAAGRDGSVLADPVFALDVLTAAGPGTDAAVVGRVLDFLRARSGAGPAGPATTVPTVTIAEAVESYERGALALMARGTQHTYRTWTRRLVADYGDHEARSVTTGDLTDLIAKHVVAGRAADDRHRSGRSAEENAVAAFRHLWGYLVEKGYVADNIAARLRKPTRAEPRRRGFTVDEAALLRQLAKAGRDPLLDEVTLVVPERLGLRRIELCRLRISDVDFAHRTVEVWGKGDKYRTMPIPPRLFDLLGTYVDDRRPAHISTGEWRRCPELLLRRHPSATTPRGRPAGRRRIEELFQRLQDHAPDVFARGDLSLHSYRHALGTFTDSRYGRPMTRAVLGHSSRRTPTDHYVHIPLEQVAEVLTAYESHLLDPQDPACSPPSSSLEPRPNAAPPAPRSRLASRPFSPCSATRCHSSDPRSRQETRGSMSTRRLWPVSSTISKLLIPATVGPTELAAGCTYVHDVELDGDENLSIGMRVEVQDESGRLFAATVTDRVGPRWQLTIQP